MPEIRVRYIGSPDSLAVRLIKTWKRGEIIEQVMSTSGGPKEYIKNDVFGLFEKDQEVDAVSMVRANGPFFLLVRKGQRYFDVGNEPVEVIQTGGRT
jgi:hypothetical protein